MPRDETEPTFSIGAAAQITGLSPEQLRRLDKIGRVKALRSPGGTRYYTEAILMAARAYLTFTEQTLTGYAVVEDGQPGEAPLVLAFFESQRDARRFQALWASETHLIPTEATIKLRPSDYPPRSS